jgi:hypothetical protein
MGMFIWCLSLLIASVYCVLYGDSTLTFFVGAILLGAFFQQLAFIGPPPPPRTIISCLKDTTVDTMA